MTSSVDLYAAQQTDETIQLRSERSESLRLIDYSPFPRMDLERGRQIGMTLNESDSGLCAAVADRVDVGELLRVIIRGVDGQSVRDVIARVVWCQESSDGRYQMGISFLRRSGARMLRVRPRASRMVAINA